MKKMITSVFLLVSFLSFGQENFNLNLSANTPKVEASSQVSSELQNILYDVIAQFHAVQQAHWNVQGPQFESLHSLLGDFYKSLSGDIDQLAERKLALGQAADGRPSAVATKAKLGDTPTGFQKDHEVIKSLVMSTKKLSDNLAESIELVGDKDVVTQDLLIGIQYDIDTYLWKLRSFSY
ncbi:Dps family protein [Gillisia sp. Hel_I_29]|uniref:Dps family protein n=1 Tax=Gillisia sp. Hel_I_29 TaxID=1249975 RepID=UPI0005575BA8|nr:DNA starvation/stationary phase protection protein [Gillisia sp. Hel_I_29]